MGCPFTGHPGDMEEEEGEPVGDDSHIYEREAVEEAEIRANTLQGTAVPAIPKAIAAGAEVREKGRGIPWDDEVLDQVYRGIASGVDAEVKGNEVIHKIQSAQEIGFQAITGKLARFSPTMANAKVTRTPKTTGTEAWNDEPNFKLFNHKVSPTSLLEGTKKIADLKAGPQNMSPIFDFFLEEGMGRLMGAMGQGAGAKPRPVAGGSKTPLNQAAFMQAIAQAMAGKLEQGLAGAVGSSMVAADARIKQTNQTKARGLPEEHKKEKGRTPKARMKPYRLVPNVVGQGFHVDWAQRLRELGLR